MPVPETMTPAEQAAVVATFLDLPDFCRKTITIRNKLGMDVPLDHSPAQLKLNAAIQKQAKKGLPIRIRALKAGQVHMSMVCCTQIWPLVAFLLANRPRSTRMSTKQPATCTATSISSRRAISLLQDSRSSPRSRAGGSINLYWARLNASIEEGEGRRIRAEATQSRRLHLQSPAIVHLFAGIDRHSIGHTRSRDI